MVSSSNSVDSSTVYSKALAQHPFSKSRLPDLSGITCSRANPVKLIDRPHVVTVLYQALFFHSNPPEFPNNKELAQALREANLPVDEAGYKVNAYAPESLVVFVKQLKKLAVARMSEITDDAYVKLAGDDTTLRRGFRKLRQPIVYRDLSMSAAKRPELLALEMRRKLTSGNSVGLFFKEERLANEVARCMLRDIFGIQSPGKRVMSLAVDHAKRFIQMERWGIEKHYFSNLHQTPPSLAELRSSFNAKVGLDTERSDNLVLTPRKVRDSSPWLTQAIERTIGSRRPRVLAPIIVDILQANVTLHSPKREWLRREVRQEFFLDLLELDGAAGDLKWLSIRELDYHASGLKSFYGSEEEPLTSREAMVALIDEFNPGGCPSLYRDFIFARKSWGAKGWLALRYCDPTMAHNYYHSILGFSAASLTSTAMVLLEKDLARSFNRKSTSIAAIADSYDVGRRGIEALKKDFRAGNRVSRVQAALRGDRRDQVDLTKLEPRNDMLTFRELGKQFLASSGARRIMGNFGKRPMPLGRLKYSSQGLLNLRQALEKFEKIVSEGEESQVRRAALALSRSLKKLADGSKKCITVKATKQTPASKYYVGDQTLNDLARQVGQIVAETDSKYHKAG